jgi:hypothetical protein
VLATRQSTYPDPGASRDNPTTAAQIVAIALPWSPERLRAMQEALGPGFVVEDIRTAPPETALVVVPPCSPGAIRAVKRTFPAARVLIVEAGATTPAGPVNRAMLAGASGYLPAVDNATLADSLRGIRAPEPD